MQSPEMLQRAQIGAISPAPSPGSRAPGLFPAFLKLAGRRCLVVGAGGVGESKIEGLLSAGAKVNVVATRASDAIAAWARTGLVSWQARRFESSDLDGTFLAIVATSSRGLNEKVYREAHQRGVLCNVVDDPAHCDFYYPAVVRRGALQIAISTDGKSPAFAQRLRLELEHQFGPEYEVWIEQLGEERRRLFEKSMDSDVRKRMLHSMASRESFERFVSRVVSASKPRREGTGYER